MCLAKQPDPSGDQIVNVRHRTWIETPQPSAGVPPPETPTRRVRRVAAGRSPLQQASQRRYYLTARNGRNTFGVFDNCRRAIADAGCDARCSSTIRLSSPRVRLPRHQLRTWRRPGGGFFLRAERLRHRQSLFPADPVRQSFVAWLCQNQNHSALPAVFSRLHVRDRQDLLPDRARRRKGADLAPVPRNAAVEFGHDPLTQLGLSVPARQSRLVAVF